MVLYKPCIQIRKGNIGTLNHSIPPVPLFSTPETISIPGRSFPQDRGGRILANAESVTGARRTRIEGFLASVVSAPISRVSATKRYHTRGANKRNERRDEERERKGERGRERKKNRMQIPSLFLSSSRRPQ